MLYFYRKRGDLQDADSLKYKIVNHGVWLSLVERYVRDVEVASSNLVTPIQNTQGFLENRDPCFFSLSKNFLRIFRLIK